MDTKANYTVIGLFVILLTTAMILGFVWLSGFSQHQSYKTYLVYARGSVTGLSVDSPVLFNGVRVGSVDKIELDNANPEIVRLFLKVAEQIPVTQSTVATLIPQGITGVVYVGLESQGAKAQPIPLEKDQPYPIIPYRKPILTQVTEVLPELTKNLGDIAEKFKITFSDKNMADISDILSHLNTITDTLNKESDNFRSSMNSLNILLKNSADSSHHFDSTFAAAQQAAAQLKQAAGQISLTINSLNQQMFPSVQELLIRLNDTTDNLQQVSQDLQKNPSILIRGKQPPPLGPGENIGNNAYEK